MNELVIDISEFKKLITEQLKYDPKLIFEFVQQSDYKQEKTIDLLIECFPTITSDDKFINAALDTGNNMIISKFMKYSKGVSNFLTVDKLLKYNNIYHTS